MTEYLFVRISEWAKHYSGGLGHLGYGKNILQRMQEGVAGSVGDPPRSVELMDRYIRQLQERYSSQHKRVVIAEVLHGGSQRDRARHLGMPHQTYRNYLNAASGFLDGCLAAEDSHAELE
jgi:DNA-directed RNA polymerase specialized sigma24 family protein